MVDTLRIATWNLQIGLALGKVLAAVSHHGDFAGLDLLALQEASQHGGVDDARRVAEALGSGYDCFQVTAHILKGLPQANALVWNTARVQIESKEILLLPAAREVQLSRSERVLLRALPQQARICLVLNGVVDEERIRIYVVHLDVIGFAHKRWQLTHILQDARSRKPVDLTIVAGDMNTFRLRSRPRWTDLADVAQNEGFRDLTSEIEWTQRVRRLRLRQKLDAILVRRTRPLHYRSWSLDIPGSDHIPVLADLELE